MNVIFFLAKRIFPNKQSGKNISKPIVRFATVSVALGLAVMIISISVLTGFQDTIKEKMIGFSAHLQILNYDLNTSFESVPINEIPSQIESIRKMDGIHHIQRYANKPGIIKTKENIHGIIAKGAGSDYDWSYINEQLVVGSVLNIDSADISNEAVISLKLSNALSLNVGDKFITSFVPANSSGSVMYRKFTIAGIYETNIEELDNRFVFIDIRHVQKLNGWKENQITGYEIALEHYGSIDEYYYKVWDEIGYGFMEDGSKLKVQSVEEQNAQMFNWLSMLDVNVLIILTIMIVVASLNMISSLLVLILEKTNMIGVLKALGMNNTSLRNIFIYNGSWLIFKGLLWGNVLGLGIVILQKYTKLMPLNADDYFIEYVPISISLLQIVALNAGTLLITALFLLLPTSIIGRIEPVKAIKFN